MIKIIETMMKQCGSKKDCQIIWNIALGTFFRTEASGLLRTNNPEMMISNINADIFGDNIHNIAVKFENLITMMEASFFLFYSSFEVRV